MNWKQIALALVLVDFVAFTGWTFYAAGGVMPWLEQLVAPGALQVTVDLVLMGAAFVLWMWRDARKTGRNPWLWTLAVCTTGSIGMMAYLLPKLAEKKAPAAVPMAAK